MTNCMVSMREGRKEEKKEGEEGEKEGGEEVKRERKRVINKKRGKERGVNEEIRGLGKGKRDDNLTVHERLL